MEELRNAKGQTEREFLEAYDPDIYPHPSCTVDMILMSVINGQLSVLLIRRKDHPWIGQWALPGGFVNIGEDLDEAVVRELKEETNIGSSNYFRQLYTLGKADRDPRTRVITTAYLSLTPEENLRDLHAGDDAEDARWFAVRKETVLLEEDRRVSTLSLRNEETDTVILYEITDKVEGRYVSRSSKAISREELAADHVKLVNMAMDEIQNHVASSGLMFSLLPEEFTLKQAQEVYESLTGNKTDTGNFRRDIMKMVLPVDKKVRIYRRYAQLYKFNPLFQFMKEDL